MYRFDDDQLATLIESMTPQQRNALPFGVIRLDRHNTVLFYSESEARFSGMGERGQVGRNFFSDIAPCFANDDYLGRIENARADGQIDIEMGVIGDFADDDSELRVRVVSAPDGGLWIFHARESSRVAA